MADIQKNSLAAWAACARPKTWLIAIAPVVTGLAVALAVTGALNIPVAAATLLLSILMQAVSNMENDAGYTKRKAENAKRKGLPRATANGWLTIAAVERAIKVLAVLALADTAYLILSGGWVMLAVFAASIVAAYCYMGGPKPIAYTPFGEITVFLFFGLVAVCGTYYLQTGTVSAEAVTAAAAVGSIAAAVLTVNNYRDEEHDASVGRCTLAVLLGKRGMLRAFYVLVLLPYALAALLILLTPSLWPVAITWGTLPAALRAARSLTVKTGLELNDVMFAVIRLELVFSLLLSVGALATFTLNHL